MSQEAPVLDLEKYKADQARARDLGFSYAVIRHIILQSNSDEEDGISVGKAIELIREIGLRAADKAVAEERAALLWSTDIPAIEPLDDDTMASLDPGVRDLVAALRAAGFNTTDSGDGVSKDSACRELDYPHVMIVVPATHVVEEAHRLQAWIDVDRRFSRWTVEASYSPKDGVALLSLFDASEP
jgi:hypothetical protein